MLVFFVIIRHMKTILVDAVNTFVLGGVVDGKMYELLEGFPNRKIILTNANDSQMVEFGLTNLPYELFTLKHEPDKTNPDYFRRMLDYFSLSPEEVVYFEHNLDAISSAKSVGINAHHYDKDKKDFASLKGFLLESL